MGKNDPQNNLECKVHQNQSLCVIDPLTPHNATSACKVCLPVKQGFFFFVALSQSYKRLVLQGFNLQHYT